jgi:DNA-binding MurR/RpiR family transcriptional regulator
MLKETTSSSFLVLFSPPLRSEPFLTLRKTILITDLLVSTMIEEATYSFFTDRGEMWEFHSMIASIAFVESMIVAVGKQLGDQALKKLNELQELRKAYSNELPKN